MNTSVEQAAERQYPNGEFGCELKRQAFIAGANWKEQQGGLRWIEIGAGFPEKSGLYKVIYLNGHKEEVGFDAFDKKFRVGTDNVNHLIKCWQESAPPNNQQGWISVEDEKPKLNHGIVVCDVEFKENGWHYVSNERIINSNHLREKYTHWFYMPPLPNPPQTK